MLISMKLRCVQKFEYHCRKGAKPNNSGHRRVAGCNCPCCNMQADRERVTAREPLSTDVEHSIGQSARPPTRHVSAARPETAQHRRASYGQPTALEYLANKGSKIQAIEAELATAQAANMTLNQQVEKLSGTVHTQTNKLAILQGGKDFLTSERARERLDIEHQLSQSEHNILTLNQSLRRSEQAKVSCRTHP